MDVELGQVGVEIKGEKEIGENTPQSPKGDSSPKGEPRTANLILGIDPGQDKTGFAFMNYEDKALILSGIFLSGEIEEFIRRIFNNKKLKFNDFFIWQRENFIKNFDLNALDLDNFIIALGDGTRSKLFHDKLKILNKKIIIVNERGTTLEARELYWKLHEPGFFKSLLPVKMRVPDRKLDDLAAWAIARRAVI